MNKFQTIEIQTGRRTLKGYLVLTPGKNSGVMIRRDKGTYMGSQFDKIEISEVFKTKETKKRPAHWTLQYNKDPDKTYGMPQKARFVIEMMADVLECMGIVYREIYEKDFKSSVKNPTPKGKVKETEVKEEPDEDWKTFAREQGIL